MLRLHLMAVCVVAGVLVATGASCDRPERRDAATATDGSGPGISAVAPGSPELAPETRHTIYVPAYSSVAFANNSQLYDLAITLSVRNTDPGLPIVIDSVQYHHQDGRLVREFLKIPLRIAPLAVLEFFIREADTSGGTASSFLVGWAGDPAVNIPLVESVMVGTAGNQGISFTCQGRPIDQKRP